MLCGNRTGLDYRKESVSHANFLDWRGHSDTITHLSALAWWDANLVADNDPSGSRAMSRPASSTPLGIRPALGRSFVRDDETWGRHHVVVISDGIWRRRFDGDPAIVGRTVTIDGEPYQVIGVAPRRFAFPDGADCGRRSHRSASAPPRRALPDGLRPPRRRRTLEDAQAEMSVVAGRLGRTIPKRIATTASASTRSPRASLDVGRGRCSPCGRRRRWSFC